MLSPGDSHNPPGRSEIYGLATIAGHASTRRDLRLKAIRALARIPDQNAIRVLEKWHCGRKMQNCSLRLSSHWRLPSVMTCQPYLSASAPMPGADCFSRFAPSQ